MKRILAIVVFACLLSRVGVAGAAPARVDCGDVKASRVVEVDCAAASGPAGVPAQVDVRKPKLVYRPDTAKGVTMRPVLAQLKRDVQELIDWTASRVGISRALLSAVARAESGGDHRVVSPRGAVGIMQLLPSTARELGVNPWDPAENVLGGAMYLKRQLDRYQGDIPRALAAYNAGPGAVDRYGGIPPFKETVTFIRNVFACLRGEP